MKKSILLIVFVSLFACSYATNPVVPVETAAQVAKNFLQEQCYFKTFSLSLQYTETDEQGVPVYYRFKINNRGFIMISASDLVEPVFGYSYESDFEACPENAVFFDGFKKTVEDARRTQVPESHRTEAMWSHYNASNFVPNQAKGTYDNYCQPLLTSSWGQTKYYNQYCPYDGSNYSATSNTKDARVMVGSAGVAMASILNYYRYPVQGHGGISYIPDGYPRIFFDLNQVQYNYDAMTSSISDYNGEVAKLLYHTGASAKTRYGAVKSDASIIDIVTAFKQFWGMVSDAVVTFRPSEVQEDSVWAVEYLIPELDAKCPILYNAYSDNMYSDNMTFIIDGYKYQLINNSNVPFFHVIMTSTNNVQKAFYRLTNFAYKYSSAYLKNLHPDLANIQKEAVSSVVNDSRSGSISDGAGNVQYQPNSNRSWLIQAPNATSYTFTFKKIKTEKNADIITIYNGPTVESGIYAQYSGNYQMPGCFDPTMNVSQQITYEGDTLPASFTINLPSVLVTFTSNDSIEDYGFVLEYTSTDDQSEIPACETTQALSTQTHYRIIDKYQPVVETEDEVNGIFSDDEPYAAHNICAWTVKPTFVSGYAFNFTKFDLKEGDFIEITTVGTVPELLYRFDVYDYPIYSTYSVDATKMNIRFVTDHWSEGNGFELEYWAILNVEQESGLNDLSVYPNPASNYINVAFSTENAQNVNANLVDMTGKVVYNTVFDHNGGSEIYKLPVSNLASGMYFLHLNTPTGKSIQKVVVK